ncbi:MAG TPA: hypothetical protein PL124_03120 [Candidatus Cloacimonadota bacterium]|nr:hypothetical protein [Candidatus Cloacimonadota bacterium]
MPAKKAEETPKPDETPIPVKDEEPTPPTPPPAPRIKAKVRIKAKPDETPTPPRNTPSQTIKARGKATKVVTLNNKDVKLTYGLVELDQITASHNKDFSPNQDYPTGKAYQPKDRSSQNYRLQVSKIINQFNPSLLTDSQRSREGAPIIVEENGQNVVLSGNGRMIALAQAYDGMEQGQAYKQYLRDNAEKFGLTAEQIDGMENPVLVRTLDADNEVTAKELADDSNEVDTSQLTPFEQASVDAANITNDMISEMVVSADGEIVSSANMPFITAFVNANIPTNDHNTWLPDGGLTVQLIQRIKKALMLKAYGVNSTTKAIISQMDSTSPEVKNIIDTAINIAPKIVKVENTIKAGDLYPLGLSEEILSAVDKSISLSRSGETYEQYKSAQGIFDESEGEAGDAIFDFMQTNKRAKKRMLGVFTDYYNKVIEFGNPNEQDIFGYKRETTKLDLFTVARDNYGKDQETIDFGGETESQGLNRKTSLPKTESAKFRQATSNTASTIGIGQIVDAIRTLLPKTTELGVQIEGESAVLTISYRGKPRQIIINALTGRITDSKGNPIYSGRTSLNRDQASNIMAIIDIVKADNEGNMTAYHEGFHLAFALFLSEKEQRTLIEAYSGKKMADMTQDEIIKAEEKAAKQFELLIQGKLIPAGVQRTTLQKLWDAIKEFARKLFGNDFAINHLDVLTRIKNADYKSSLLTRKPVFGDRYMASEAIAEAEAQMEAVRVKYQGTEQWMKAPNGKPTKLNERQWLQVRTENFLNWFGDWINDPANASKVVDENGEPMVVWHSTDARFNVFDIAKARSYSGELNYDLPGFYFTGRKEFADDYGARTISAFVNIKNPFTGVDLWQYKKDNGLDLWRQVYDNLIAGGYDGAIMDEGANNAEEEIIAFSPTQIKSATANVGTFDPENADIRYQEAVDADIDPDAALSADATLQAIMDSGVNMSIRLKGFIHKMLIVLAKDQKASQKEQLNIMMKKFHEYVKVTLPKMGFTKAMVLHITTRFGNIRTVKSFIKEAQKLDKIVNEAYGKKMYAAVMDASRASISEKVNLKSTSMGKTDVVAMEKLKYINSVLHMNAENQSAEFDRLESIEPGENMSNEESEMLEFKKWAVQLFSGLKVPEVTKGGATRYDYADPAKLAMAYHEIGSLVANGKTLQAERMAKIKAEQDALRYKIKAMLLGGGSTLTDFERQDLEKKRKKKIPNIFEAFHAQLAYLETIFEEMDNLSLRNHKKLIEYKKTLEQSIKDYSANLDEESTDKDMLALLDMKEHLSHIIELISETADYKGMYNGWFQDVFYDDLYKAKAKQEAGTINFAELFKAKRKEFAKKAGLDKFWFSYGSASLNQTHREIDMVDSDGSRQKRKFSMQQIMAIYAYTLDPKLQVTLQNTGFDDASLADLDRILTESKTGQYAKMFVDYIVNEFMPMYFETINPVYVERYGFDLPQEMNYFPVIRRFPKDVKMNEPGEPRRIISESMYVGNTSLIQRVNSGLPLALDKLSFDAQLITHVHNMEHFKAFAMPMYRARMTILKRDVAQAFQDVLGRQRWDTLVGFYRDEAANGYTQINKTTTDRIFNTLMNNAAFAFLNLKPSVGIKQMSSTILMAAYMNPLEAAENYAWASAHPGKMWEILRKSPTFQIRYKQGITAEQHMALQHGDSSTITSLLRQYINDYINFGKYGDMVSVIVGGGAFYHQEYKRLKKANPKMSDEELEYQSVKQMEKMVERTQQSASILYSSRIRRDSMIGRMATQFQTQFHALYNAIYNKSNELRIPNADRGKTAWGLAMLVALYPMVAAFFDEGLVPPDDPKDVAMDVISQNLMLIPVFGNLIDTILNAIVTGNTRQDYSRIFPSSSLLDSAMGSLNNAKQLKNDRSFRKHFEMMARIMLLVGAPIYPLHQTIYGISDYVSGKDDRIGRVFGYSKGSLDMAEKENKANNK